MREKHRHPMTKSLVMPCDSCQQEKKKKLHYFTYSIVFNVVLHSLSSFEEVSF